MQVWTSQKQSSHLGLKMTYLTFSPWVMVLKLHSLIETVKLFYKHQQKSTSCKTSMQLRILGNVVCTTPY